MWHLDVFDFPYFIYIVFAWGVFFLVYAIAVAFTSRNLKTEWGNIMLGMGLIALGFVTGLLMANNRSPISDTVLSSVFALLGVVVTYAFFQKPETKEDQSGRYRELVTAKANRLVVALFLTLFSVAFLYGSHTGAKFRLENEDYSFQVEYIQKIKKDSLDVIKKTMENEVEIKRIYYEKIYQTWSDNERKRYEKQLSRLKAGDSIPEIPDYFKSGEENQQMARDEISYNIFFSLPGIQLISLRHPSANSKGPVKSK